MALIMKCDVCEKAYEPYNFNSIAKVSADETPNAIRLVSYAIGDTSGVSGKRYDLCPDCMKKIIDILKLENKNNDIKDEGDNTSL